jgi:hypothetical protein
MIFVLNRRFFIAKGRKQNLQSMIELYLKCFDRCRSPIGDIANAALGITVKPFGLICIRMLRGNTLALLTLFGKRAGLISQEGKLYAFNEEIPLVLGTILFKLNKEKKK